MSMVLFACSPVKQDRSGVSVRLSQPEEGGAKIVRLQPVADNIIRVSATAESRFADRQSLMIVDQPAAPAFSVEKTDTTVSLLTAALCATVDTRSGRVTFADLDGNLILQELAQGGKTFAPYECSQIHADGTPETYHGWTTRVRFENLYPQEGLYGLGQHQGDEWNWKGRNEQLYQYNTKVSLPFVVSSMGYGILFDSYSLCRFGNPLPYSQLHELFALADKDGVEGALTGTYKAPYDGPVEGVSEGAKVENGMLTLVRREDSIYFDDIFRGKNLPAGFPLQEATVVYEGTITPRETGTYQFNHYYSGYQRLFLADEPLSDEIWRTAWNPNARKYDVYLEAGHAYPIRLEWRPDGGEAYCSLTGYAPVDPAVQQQLSFWSEMTRQLDYYFISGTTTPVAAETNLPSPSRGKDVSSADRMGALDQLISGYRKLTGPAPIMPLWAHGYWQSRERYKTQDEILSALDGFRQRHLPIDNIVMDWNYWADGNVPGGWGAFRFDPERFTDPQLMIDSIHRQNARIMISCWPKYYPATSNFRELQDRGYIYQQSLRDSLIDWLGCPYAFYDAYQPEAQQIFWRQLWENLGVMGMDAWWMDASEPNVRDCTPIEYRKLLCGPTYLGSSDEYFNAYSLVNAKAIYDGQRATQPADNRVFLLTRNGFCGQQRYSTATWSGDIGTRWEDMRAQVTAGLNFSIAGIPYWSQDIGGFSVENRFSRAQQLFDLTGRESDDLREWRELNARWHQWGMFTPMYRSHGQFPFREPWNIAPEGHPAYQSIADCLRLRMRLMPYIYSLAGAVHFADYTMLRPLVMDYPSDPAVINCAYQFQFGPALMVCPVLSYGQRTLDVYFPRGTVWYDFFTGKRESCGGEHHAVSAPYDRTPVFVPAGSILPLGPDMEYTAEKPAERIDLYVYAGADGAFSLYEDEGTNYGYEQGRYACIPFTYADADRVLTIGDRQGTFPGMLEQRTFAVHYISAAPDGQRREAVFTVPYDGRSAAIQLP